MMRPVLLLLALLVPGVAVADPISIFMTLAPYVGNTVAAFVASYATTIAVVSMTAYTSISARNKAKRAAAAARAAYNAGLTDRSVTALTADPPWRVVYGRAETGGDLMAMFTTDKSALDERGNPYVKPDAYKHLVIVWASHQCQAVNDVKIDGVSLGALDGGGWATGPEWVKSATMLQRSVSIDGALRAANVPATATIINVVAVQAGGSWESVRAEVPAGGTYGYTRSGDTLTLPAGVDVSGVIWTPVAGDSWEINYKLPDASGTSVVRVLHHLGSAAQAADATLMALVPAQWTANHRLRGRCYSVVTLDLEHQQFQGGPPGITADISGALVLDPRTSATAWSANPALCAYDWLRSASGYALAASDIDTASVIAAANACDTSTSFTVGTDTTTGPLYTCNGVFTSAAPKEAVLADLVESMAGFASYGGAWRVGAGVWTPPVMDLTDDDLAGSIDIVQAGEPSNELFNTVRGQYVPALSAIPADMEPYANAVFVAADGRALWHDIDLPFTDNKARAKNLARILVEQSRAGLVIFFPAKLRAWPLQTGDRVTVTSAEYGFAAKIFRVTDWAFGLRSPVGLTLQEDDATIYDLADAAVADPTPNTGLPNPWQVPPITGLAADSGTAQLLKQSDGTVTSRVKIVWTRSTAAYMQGGRIEIIWRAAATSTWTTVLAAGDDTQAYLTAVRDGDVLVIGVTAVNALGARSPTVYISHKVLGKTDKPSDPSGLVGVVKAGQIKWTWDPCTDGDYSSTELRIGGADWISATLPAVFNGKANTFTQTVTAAATYRGWIKHVDTSGNYSTNALSYDVIVGAADLGAGTLVNIYCRSATAPALPSADCVYTFATGAITGLTGTWQATIPAGTDPIYVSNAFALAGNPTATIVPTDWATAVIFVQNGLPGADATQAATVNLYQWGTVAPSTNPSGQSTYTWATAAQSAYTGGGGWSLTIPNNPGTPGVQLWVASKAITAIATATTTTVSWAAGYTVAAWSGNGANGANGANGLQSATARIYQWATSTPAGPSGAATYTWASGLFGAAPAGWSLTKGTGTAGQSLWVAEVALLDSAANATTAFNWTGAAISAIGYIGSSGTAGASARYCYQRVPGNPAPVSGSITTVGSASFPTSTQSNTAWGINQAWVGSDPNPSSTDTLYQADGIFDPATGNTVWTTPYISSLKVGSLSAISANLGTITAGTINSVTINGTTITGGVLQTATSGKRVVINEAASNQLRVYADIGAGAEKVVEVGDASMYGTQTVATFGSASVGVNRRAGAFFSNSVEALYAQSSSGMGVYGHSSSAQGVYGSSDSNVGVYGYGGAWGTAGFSPSVGVYGNGGTYAFQGIGGLHITGMAIINNANGLMVQDGAGNSKVVLYYNSGAAKIETVGAIDIQFATNGAVNVIVNTSGLKALAGFGCNGKAPQAAAASGGTLAGVIAALVANGILSS